MVCFVTYHSKPGALSWLFILHNYMDLTQILLLTIINVLQCRDIGSRKESDADMGIEDFDLYCIRNNLVEIKQPPDQKQSGEMQGLSH